MDATNLIANYGRILSVAKNHPSIQTKKKWGLRKERVQLYQKHLFTPLGRISATLRIKNSMPTLIHFEDALKKTKDKDRSLLLGNGFSIAQTCGELSYNNLLEKSALQPPDKARAVFDSLNTVDFELVIEALEHAAKIAKSYGDATNQNLFEKDSRRVREALINAIKEVHPSVQKEIPDKEFKACGNFIDNFKTVFTLNYDLLLYWVNLNNSAKHTDGFGFGGKTNGFRTFSEDADCSMFHLHGGLHLFSSNTGETLKKTSSGYTLLSDIETEIRKNNLPLFVAEGTSDKKLAKINSSPYLRHCLDTLKSQAAPIFIFGHSAELKDKHLYKSIFSGKSEAVYICVFGESSESAKIEKLMNHYIVDYGKKDIFYIDANSMNIWGK